MTTRRKGPPGGGRRARGAKGKRAQTARMAEGSVVQPLRLRQYRVVIEYREPTYATYAGSAPKTYRGTFVVEAYSPEGAETLARQEFREVERLSSVGWSRDIVRVVTAEGGERSR